MPKDKVFLAYFAHLGGWNWVIEFLEVPQSHESHGCVASEAAGGQIRLLVQEFVKAVTLACSVSRPIPCVPRPISMHSPNPRNQQSACPSSGKPQLIPLA